MRARSPRLPAFLLTPPDRTIRSPPRPLVIIEPRAAWGQKARQTRAQALRWGFRLTRRRRGIEVRDGVLPDGTADRVIFVRRQERGKRMADTPIWEVVLYVDGPVTVHQRVLTTQQKGFRVDDPFYSDIEIMGLPSGLKA